jgi:hypothetical protein
VSRAGQGRAGCRDEGGRGATAPAAASQQASGDQFSVDQQCFLSLDCPPASLFCADLVHAMSINSMMP